MTEDSSSTLLKEIVSTFLNALGYCSPAARSETMDLSDTETFKSLHAEFSAYNDGDRWYQAMCLEATALAELPYPAHPAEIRLHIARYTWYLLFMDDLGHKIPAGLRSFQRSVLAHGDSEATPLDGFHENLRSMYRFWDTIPANCITVSGFDFITGRIMEDELAVNPMKPSRIAISWPNFLRVKTGGAAAYAFFIFTKDHNPEISTYIHMIEDIHFFLDYVNDLLSFYKEAIEGETDNYIHARAKVTGKTVPETLRDVADEVLAAHSRITEALEITGASTPWNFFAKGVLDFHFSLKRYRLSDLGF